MNYKKMKKEALLIKILELEQKTKRLEVENNKFRSQEFYQDHKRYEKLVNLLTDYIYTVKIINGEAAETLHGPGCISVTGYTSEDYVRNPELWYNMVHEDDREAVTKQASLALAGSDVDFLEHRIYHKDGSIRWVRNTIFILRDENGIAYAYNGLINDITEMKWAELILVESEEKYRSLTDDVLENSSIAISILDSHYNIVWVNRAYEIFLGVDRKTITGKNSGKLVPKKIAPLFKESQKFKEKVLATYNPNEKSVKFECCVRGRTGVQQRWLEFWSIPIKTGLYKGGRIEHFSDITEHKLIIDEVVESERRQIQLLHYFTDYIYTVKVKNKKAVLTFHGPGCNAVTGYTQEDFAIKPELWIEMVYEPDRTKVRKHAQKALYGIESPPLEHRIVHRNGSLRWVKSTIVLEKNEQGNVISYDGLINDITKLKKAEKLDKLRQKQLIQADKMVTLGILVSGVAHEINNPNTFILLNAQMIEKAWKSTKPILDEYYDQNGDFVMADMPYSIAQKKLFELTSGIIKGSERIQKIVSSLKDYSRQDQGDKNCKININNVVEAAILIVSNVIKKNTDEFRVEYDKTVPKIKGNFQRLEQVLINLITNSCQSLESGTKKIHIKTSCDHQSQIIRIEIHDTGIGMSSEDQKHIFDPFFTTKRDKGGTGLGLSIAYNIIKDHQGELLFNSTPNKGTRAMVILPLDN